ncbi:hypothetical protein BHWA1_02048 [Brachyspira hyodysenteriae WA1]|uniref:30S ribosomal protein S16 n=1 Tax=Brachyspira hyodysenteriae (strain ATCC 49526 / WA1) TaxID=565034 RepID=A0A3B6VCL0_BRAHW|nr:hypothetical protein BHWA1_02048 [Brachyspira hyodysenteriae WA1]
MNVEGLKKWLSNGAQPTYVVKSILVKEGLMEKDKGAPIERKKKRALKNPEKRRKHRKQAKPESAEEKSEA